MNFGFSEEQNLLRDQVRRFLDARAPLSVVRRLQEEPEGFSREQWKEMAELGWLGLLAAEADGGLGLGWVDLIVVLEEMGRSLYPSPFISTSLAVALLAEHGSSAQRSAWLPRIVAGDALATVAAIDEADLPAPDGVRLEGRPEGDRYRLDGSRSFVADAGVADLFLVAFRVAEGDDGLRLALLDRSREGVTASARPTMDPGKRSGRLTLDGVVVESADLLCGGGSAADAIRRHLDQGAVAVCAEAVGAADAALAMTTEYARTRIQFGEPIGRYQGVKHRLAEIFVDVESARSLLYYAAWTVSEAPAELPRAVSLAKGWLSDALPQVGIDGVQLHGAIGFTAEYDIQLYLKRSKWTRAAFGDADWHYERVAGLGGL